MRNYLTISSIHIELENRMENKDFSTNAIKIICFKGEALKIKWFAHENILAWKQRGQFYTNGNMRRLKSPAFSLKSLNCLKDEDYAQENIVIRLFNQFHHLVFCFRVPKKVHQAR